MGCPKSFSISGGMGAALLTKPELIHDILTTLKRNLDTLVTCKIQLLKSSKDTVELAWRIEKAAKQSKHYGKVVMKYPAPLALTAYVCLTGVIIDTGVALASEGLVVSALATYVQNILIQSKGSCDRSDSDYRRIVRFIMGQKWDRRSTCLLASSELCIIFCNFVMDRTILLMKA
ncbi:hypothetical protein HYC85_012464 [Camellia sinensis]|uniref:DUS-like FMN-binding domain-containing protein n=1 Tax=Camellia sinensis TaxID=4442 RepID=A0A7J7HE20_CAMSI|nr:hypothetical protein HYC85_012464 [Camellia sinensis]